MVVTRGAVDPQANVLLPYTTIIVILAILHSWELLVQPAADLLTLVAYLLIILGLVGAILPILPGAVLIWLGALVWAWVDGFQAVGWPTLAVLGVLMVLAWTSDLVLTTLGTRKAGASWKAVAGAIAGGLVYVCAHFVLPGGRGDLMWLVALIRRAFSRSVADSAT